MVGRYIGPGHQTLKQTFLPSNFRLVLRDLWLSMLILEPATLRLLQFSNAPCNRVLSVFSPDQATLVEVTFQPPRLPLSSAKHQRRLSSFGWMSSESRGLSICFLLIFQVLLTNCQFYRFRTKLPSLNCTLVYQMWAPKHRRAASPKSMNLTCLVSGVLGVGLARLASASIEMLSGS